MAIPFKTRPLTAVNARPSSLASAHALPDHSALVQQLLELVDALDRRMPHVMRAGEAAIARDAATLRQQALRRIEELCAETD